MAAIFKAGLLQQSFGTIRIVWPILQSGIALFGHTAIWAFGRHRVAQIDAVAYSLTVGEHCQRLADALVGKDRRLALGLFVPCNVVIWRQRRFVIPMIGASDNIRALQKKFVLLGVQRDDVLFAVGEHDQFGGVGFCLQIYQPIERRRNAPVVIVAKQFDLARIGLPSVGGGHAIRAGADQKT